MATENTTPENEMDLHGLMDRLFDVTAFMRATVALLGEQNNDAERILWQAEATTMQVIRRLDELSSQEHARKRTEAQAA